MNSDCESPLGDPELHESLRKHAHVRLRRHFTSLSAAARADRVDDMVQECLKRGQMKLATFDPAKATFAGWMHGIMNHILMEDSRKLRKQPVQSADLAAWEDTRAKLEPDADREVLNGLLARLTPQNREIVSLHHLEGWSHEKIAAKLGVSKQVTRTRLCRALGELKLHAAKEGVR